MDWLNLGGHIATSTLLNAHVTKVNDTEISGYFDTAGRVWGGVDVAKVYFVVQFDKPMDALNGWVGDRKETDINSLIGSPELITVPKSSFKQSPSSGVEAVLDLLRLVMSCC